jgi:hypothetical protein
MRRRRSERTGLALTRSARVIALVLATACLAMPLAGATAATAEPSDTSFNNGGLVPLPVPGPSEARVVAVQNPGLIVAGTSKGSLFLARIAWSDGSFDRSFRAGHLVVAGLGAFVPLDVATFPDTRILVLGRTDHGNEVVGFTHDGELDPTFGSGGIATIPGPARATGRLFFYGFNQTYLVAPDLYTITVDGANVPTTPDPNYSPPDSPAIEAGAIYYAQGPQVWFSNRQRNSTWVDNSALPGTPTAIAVSSWDNRVFQGGSLPTGAGSSDLFVRAFLPGGAIDSHFGHDGTVRLDIGQVDGVSGIVASYDRVVIVGSARRSGGRTDLVILSLHLDGTPFPTLGNDGVWTTPVFGPADGQVEIGGTGLGDGVIVPGHTPAGVAALFRTSPSSLPPGHPLAWGWNGAGQLGDGTTADRHAPVSTSGLVGAVSVAAGGYHSLAVSADGNATSWGWNPVGELGDGTTTDRSTPVPVLSGVVAVSAGMLHSLALRAGRHSLGVGLERGRPAGGWHDDRPPHADASSQLDRRRRNIRRRLPQPCRSCRRHRLGMGVERRGPAR